MVKDNVQESVFSFYYVGPEDGTQIVRLGANAFTHWAISAKFPSSKTQGMIWHEATHLACERFSTWPVSSSLLCDNASEQMGNLSGEILSGYQNGKERKGEEEARETVGKAKFWLRRALLCSNGEKACKLSFYTQFSVYGLLVFFPLP